MSKRGNTECLTDLIEAMERIGEYLKGLDYAKFLEDTKTQDAVVRNIEIIGEAAKNISLSFKEKHPGIP